MNLRLVLPLAAATLGTLSASAAPALADDHGMSARYEHRYHVTRPGLDPDRDGLTNLQEYHLGTNPRRADSDRDGIRDGDEDFDRDGVDNANELREGTDPRRRDTDGDGISDGAEDADHDGLTNAAEDRLGADPVDRDTDDDGVPDGREHAGTVATFAAGVLTISLPDGSTITAHVTPATVVKCRTESEYQSAYVRHSPHPTAVAAGHAGPGPSGPGSGGHGGSGSSGGGYDDPATAGTPTQPSSDPVHPEDSPAAGTAPVAGAPASGPYPADDHGGHGEDHAAAPATCSPDQPGAVVHDAELALAPEGLVVTELELVVPGA